MASIISDRVFLSIHPLSSQITLHCVAVCLLTRFVFFTSISDAYLLAFSSWLAGLTASSHHESCVRKMFSLFYENKLFSPSRSSFHIKQAKLTVNHQNYGSTTLCGRGLATQAVSHHFQRYPVVDWDTLRAANASLRPFAQQDLLHNEFRVAKLSIFRAQTIFSRTRHSSRWHSNCGEFLHHPTHNSIVHFFGFSDNAPSRQAMWCYSGNFLS